MLRSYYHFEPVSHTPEKAEKIYKPMKPNEHAPVDLMLQRVWERKVV